MGIVYLAEHVHLRREAQSNALVRHPGIVDVYDCGVGSDGRMYIVMEYFEGQNSLGLESAMQRSTHG